jgi:hypothetical protein
VRTIFLAVRLVLEELARQAPRARLVALSLPPLQPEGPDGKVDRWGGILILSICSTALL